MRRYWILSMSEDNYLISKEHGLIGITDHGKYVIYRMAIGDMVTFYIPRKKVDSRPNDPAQHVRKIRGIARVTGAAFKSDEAVWHLRHNEPFPHRRRVEFLSDATTNAQPMLEGLSYVTNKLHWALPLRNGYVEVTQKDFETIQSALQPRSQK
jgi:hypothetical protein